MATIRANTAVGQANERVVPLVLGDGFGQGKVDIQAQYITVVTDVLTSRQRSYNMSRIRGSKTAPEMAVRSAINMSRIRGSKTAPEMAVRSAIRGLGLRYRTNAVA